jgi:hypothetical protein
MKNETKTYKRSMGLILPGFGDKEAVVIEQYNGKARARFTIRDLIRDKMVTITLWEGVVAAKRDYLIPGSLVVADGVYSSRDKKNVKPGEDKKMHSISVSRTDGLWVQPSADFVGQPSIQEGNNDDVPLGFDEMVRGDIDEF